MESPLKSVRWLGWCYTGLALFAGLACAGPSRGAEASARMDEIVQRYAEAQQFTGAVLVAHRGAPLLDRAYGLANREWEIANTPATHFRIGSITKQFTAVAILLLEQRGKLELSDAVSVHFPGAPASWSKITLYHLLTHTSGIANVTSDPEFMLWKTQTTTVRHLVSRFRDLPLDFAPGERHAYSNSNYLVLGLIVETIARQRFGDFLSENVLTPLGLKNTGIDSNLRILPRRADGYIYRRGEFFNAPYTDMTVPHAAGAMYSTTHDLWRWAEAIFGDKLLTPASRTKLLTPAQNSYALGVKVVDSLGRKRIEHGGSISGFASFLAHYPDEAVTVVVLANLGTPITQALARELAEAVFEGDAPKAARTR